MARQQALATVWQPIQEHEPIEIVADDGNPMRGFLIGLGISAVVWAGLAVGIWFVLRLLV